MTEEALKAYVDDFARGHVTHFFMCPVGQRASYDSKVWEPIWAGMDEPAYHDFPFAFRPAAPRQSDAIRAAIRPYIDRGLLSMDDPVEKYVPEFTNAAPGIKDPYSVGAWLYGDWMGHEGAMCTAAWHKAADDVQGTPVTEFGN